MCGIFGIFSTTNYENYYQKINNKDFLKHRGPDNQSTYFDKNIFLYHSRLAIIDGNNKNSNQPMQDNSGRWKIIFNGEIYNYLEIKDKLSSEYNFITNSDTEVLLASFILNGPQSLNEIRGMFSAVIFDSLKKKIFLFRDRYGIKPLIYTTINNKIFFSSELKAFKKIDIKMNLNKQSLFDVFKYGSVKQEKTIYKNFYSIKPGFVYEYGLNNEIKIERYLRYSTKPTINSISEIKSSIEETIKLNCVSDVDIGILLSGGLDSNIILNYLKKFTDKKIKGYTLYYQNDHKKFNEINFAKISAKHFGIEHECFELKNEEVESLFRSYIDSIDQPSIDGFNTYIITKKIKKEVKVVLSGLGGDEIFLGYDHYYNIIKNKDIKDNHFYKLIREINSYVSNPLTKNLASKGLSIYKMIEIFREQFTMKEMSKIFKESLNEELLFHDKYELKEQEIEKNSNILNFLSNYELENYLKNTLLRDSDVVAMGNSIELRPVFLDSKLISNIQFLNKNLEIGDFKQKKILFDLYKDELPEYFYNKNYRKKGFNMPFRDWLNKDLKNYFLDIVENSSTYDLFSEKFLQNLKDKIKNGSFFRQKEWIYIVTLSWINKNL